MPARVIEAKTWKSFRIREQQGWKVTCRGCVEVNTRVRCTHRNPYIQLGPAGLGPEDLQRFKVAPMIADRRRAHQRYVRLVTCPQSIASAPD
jgi:hypothetical protein